MAPATPRTPVCGSGIALLGRDRELDALERVLASAARGRGRVVLVAGEAGIGKTALVDSISSRAAAAGAKVVRGQCSGVGPTPPFAPWIAALALGGFEKSGGNAGLVANGGTQVELLDAVIDALRALASEAAFLVVVLEDMHWADAESVDLVRWVSGQIAALSVVVIATHREGDGRAYDRRGAALTHLVRESGALRLPLDRWTAEQVSELVAARFGEHWPHRAALAEVLKRYGEGNPFFVQELLRGLESDRRLIETSSGWVLGDLAELRGAPVPKLLGAVLCRRVDECREGTRAAVEVAAVLGHELDYEVWRATLGASDEEMITIVDECLDRGVLEEVDRRGRLRFRHALLRESVYFDASLPRRKVLHRRAAAALQATAEADPGVIAHHLEQAGEAAAVEWWVQAAQRATRSFARATAAEALLAAARLLSSAPERRLERAWYLLAAANNARESPDSPEPLYDEVGALAGELEDAVLRMQVRWSRGLTRCYRGRNGLDDMRAAFAASRELENARRCYPADLAALAQPVEPGLLAFWSAVFGYYDEALRWAQAQSSNEALAASRGVGGFSAAFALAGRAYALSCLGSPTESERWFERTRDTFRSLGHRWAEAVHTWIEYVAHTLPYHGHQPGRRLRMEERLGALWRGAIQAATRLPAELGLFPAWFLSGRWDAIAAWDARCEPAVTYEYAPRAVLGQVMRMRGNSEESWRQVHLCLPDGPTTPADAVMVLEGLELRRLAAELAMDVGEVALAAEWIEAYARTVALGGRVLGRAEEALLRAELAGRRGEPEASRTHALRALAEANEPRQVFPLASATRVLGRLALAAGDLDEARSRLEAAQRLWDTTGARHEIALTQAARAELAIEAGDHESASALLESAGAVLAELRASLLLRAVEQARGRLDPSRRSPPARGEAGLADWTGELTARERSVLALLARGASNREIAVTLVISVRTVERHVSNIYAKTGAINRATATAYALRRGIV